MPRPALEAAGLAAALVLGWTLRATTPAAVEDLRPRPDAVEYEEAARHLVRGDGYWLHIAGERYPPRYPFGTSALIAPALLVLGDAPGTGVAPSRPPAPSRHGPSRAPPAGPPRRSAPPCSSPPRRSTSACRRSS